MTKPLSLDRMRADIATMILIEPDEISEDDNLLDLGLDSMRAMNLVLLWQTRGVSLDFSELASRPTLGGWWQIARQRMAATAEAGS